VREAYAVADGIRVFYVENGPPDGPLVLLCHGFPEFWWSWRHQLGPLGDAGYHAVAIDLPGYGRSDKPDVRYDALWLTDRLAGLVEALGHQRVAIVGHDWGGLLAWPFARRFPERTAHVIGVNTPDLPRTQIPPVELFRQLRPDEPIYIVQFQEPGAAEFVLGGDADAFMQLMLRGPATYNHDAFPDDVVRRYADQFRARGSLTPPLDYYRNMDRNWELTADIAGRTIDVPCLMICAEHDPVLSPALADGMEDRVPNLTKVLIRECGHWTQQERPDETTKAMLDFLDAQPPWN
jgi:pimeloyl-ACP methyl ester carboxylesterase